MDLQEFWRLPKEQRDAMLAWLHKHGLRYCYQFEIIGGHLEADIYSTDDDGQRYLIHSDGTRHGQAYGCFLDGQRSPGSCPGGLDVAREHLVIPMRSQPPVPV